MAGPLDPTYGAMLIGLLFATFFQGVLTVQAYIYYESFPNDSRRNKLLVAGVWLLDVLHLVLIADSAYHYLVTEWGNAPALQFSTQELDLHLVIVGLATIVCQCFFLQRIWVFSNKNIVVTGFLLAGCLTTLGLDVSMSIQISSVPLVSSFGNFTPEVIAVFSIGAGVDLLMALILAYYLRRGKSGFEKTNSVLSRVIQYTVATGLATSLLAIACLIAYLARPNTFIFIAMHFSLGRMYTNALIATLNSRRSLRAYMISESSNAHRIDRWGDSTEASTIGTPQFAKTSFSKNSAVPLRNFSNTGSGTLVVQSNTVTTGDA